MTKLQKIKDCDGCELRKKSKENFTKSKKEEIFYALYYTESNIPKTKYIFLMQNPGMPKGFERTDEFKELENCDSNTFTEATKDGLKEWLKNGNKDFTEKFLEVLKKYGLIHYEDWKKYIDEKFLEDFIVTDLVKCRTKTKIVDKVKDSCEKCYSLYLAKELEEFAKNKLIFCFSTRTWSTLYKNLEIEEKMEIKKKFKRDKVAQVHGYLFYSRKFGCYLIPLVHFSQTQFNNYLRSSYFDYLEEGLKRYNEIK